MTQPPDDRSTATALARIDSSFDYSLAIDFLYGRIDYERQRSFDDAPHPGHGKNPHPVPRPQPFRLDGTRELFRRLGLAGYLFADDDSLPPIPLVHIAGTKGKGSTSTMVSCILSAAGYRVGLYTSPHLTHIEERFRVDNRPCSRRQLTELVFQVRAAVNEMELEGRTPSFFELSTALAVLHFHRMNCDVIVLEVGLGGRLDSTNVCKSTIAAITSIGLDHQHLLGNTIGAIASEKAGIIKSSQPVISGATQEEAREVIRATASLAGGDLFELDVDFHCESAPETPRAFQRVGYHVSNAKLEWESCKHFEFDLALRGRHQARNAAVAVSIVRRLAEFGFNVDAASIQAGLSERLVLEGRIESFPLNDRSGRPLEVIVDTAHNPDSLAALVSAVRPGRAAAGPTMRMTVYIISTSRDKDVASMAEVLLGEADHLICTQFQTNPRAISAAELTKQFASAQASETTPVASVHEVAEPERALKFGLDLAFQSQSSMPPLIVICGSFFLAGELRPIVERMAAESATSDSFLGERGSS
ncbi:MAG: Mur ligase family protein [Planctomycetota bacterium]